MQGWPRQRLEEAVDEIMGNQQGDDSHPRERFSSATVVYEVSTGRSAGEDPDPGRIVGEFLADCLNNAEEHDADFLDAMMTRLKSLGIRETTSLKRHLKSARELLGFGEYGDQDVDSIVAKYRSWLPQGAIKKRQESRLFLRLLAVLHQPKLVSRVTARVWQKEIWSPLTVAALHYMLENHNARARALAQKLGLISASEQSETTTTTQTPVSDKEPSANLRRLRSLSETYSQDLNAAASQFDHRSPTEKRIHTLSGGLYIRRSIQTRLVNKIKRLTESRDRRPIIVKGEAGHGKSCLMWALGEDLRILDGISSILLNATWLMPDSNGRSAISRQEVVDASVEIESRGNTPVILIDTADLLLHHEINIADLIALCRELDHQQAVVVLTCRPEEAGTLDNLEPDGFELKFYDDNELADAIERYADTFCPNAEPRDPRERIRRITEPVARGLALREVCRSPLLMRLLFELNAQSETFPELREIDVSTIFDNYWDRRIRSDRRLDRGPSHLSASRDLSDITGKMALVLLAMGSTEVEREELVEELGPLVPDMTEKELNQAINELLQRSVLTEVRSPTKARIRFFHQTMFEYASAKGLIAKYRLNAPYALLSKLMETPEDLFVGAVLEQVLILLGRNRRYQGAFTKSVEVLVKSTNVSLHNIALAAAAHHPSLSAPIITLLETAKEETASRYVQIAPSVADVDLHELLTKLRVVWSRERCRTAVLETLERLAARDPRPILTAIRNWECVDAVSEMGTGRIRFPSLPRILGMCATADPEFARSGLLDLFYRPGANGEEVTSEPKGEPGGRHYHISIMKVCLRYWPILASTDFIEDLTDRFSQLQGDVNPAARDMQQALGRLLGEHCLEAYAACLTLPHAEDATSCGMKACWKKYVESVIRDVETNDQNSVTNAELVGIGYVLTKLPPRHWAVDVTLSMLTSMNGQIGPFALPRGLFLEMLERESAATRELESRLARMLEGLPAKKNRPELGEKLWAAVSRQGLRNAELSPSRLAEILEWVAKAQQQDIWLKADGLAWLLVPAAMGNHPIAKAALARVISSPADAAPEAHGLIRDPLHHLVAKYPDTIGTAVHLAVAQQTTSPLNAIIGAQRDALSELGNPLRVALEPMSEQIWNLIQALLASKKGSDNRHGTTLWLLLEELSLGPTPELSRVSDLLREVIDYRARGSILEICGSLAVRKKLPFEEVQALLRERFLIDGYPPEVRAIVKERNFPGKAPKGLSKEARDFAIRARDSYVGMVCQLGSIDEQSIKLYGRMAAAIPTSSDVLGCLGHVVRRLIEEAFRPVDAARYFLDIAQRVVPDLLGIQAQEGQRVLSEDNLGNNLRPAMRSVFKSRDPQACSLLLNAVPNLPETHARMVVASAASEARDLTYDQLSRLLTLGDRLPRGVAIQIDSDRRKVSRSVSRIQLDDILNNEYRPQPPKMT
ncbi:MAG TPA: hypothetical protein VFV67_24320 [Actinophytocola sp.]|uniref:hypothetical protein n=1 Tax=Actinophytocola sp. TaxID=1872138 RepID=UPI002DBB1A57|nr:hypothetical protein [Actinophytocola sp.]HEU5473783.1 hypothetical protein [Actinophytocola sp.]